MAEPYVPYSQGTFDPYTGETFGAPPAGGTGSPFTPDSYNLINVYQTWQQLTRRPEYQAKDPNGKLEILNRFVEQAKEDYGPNPHGLGSLQASQAKLIKGEAAPKELSLGDALAEEQYYYDLGRVGIAGDETKQELRNRIETAYEEYVRNGGIPHAGLLTGLGAALTHTIGSAAAGAGAGAAAGAPFAGVGAGPGAAIGGVATAAAESGIRERGRALQLRMFANLDAGMDPDEAWSKAQTAANITGAVVGTASTIDPTKRVGAAAARGAFGRLPQQAMARGAATTGATRFGLERAGQAAVVGGLGAGTELIDYTQSRALGNVDDSYLMGSLGERMVIGGVAGAGIHGTAPVLGKAFKTAKVFGSKDFKGKSWAAKYNKVFSEENTAGAIGHLQLLAEDAKAGKRPGGAAGLDVMEPSRYGHRVSPDEATKAAMDMWNILTDGTEPVKFRVVDDATGKKVVADDVDAQYNHAKKQIDAYLNMFRWDKDEGQRVTINHEAAHAFMDTLPTEVVDGLRKLWKAETEQKAGPLYRDPLPDTEVTQPKVTDDPAAPKAVREMGGETVKLEGEKSPQLRDNINPDVEMNFKEWFADHMAIANDAWAKNKIDNAAKGKAVSEGIFGRLSEVFRGKAEKVGRRLGMRPEGMYSAFRDFMDSGDAYTFGRTDKTAKQNQVAWNRLMKQMESWPTIKGGRYPTRADLQKATEWVEKAGIEGRKRPPMEVAEIDAPEAAPAKMSGDEVASAQARVAEIDGQLAVKGVSRKKRNTLKAEKREIQQQIGEQFLETQTKPRPVSEARKAEGRDAVEFAESPEVYKLRKDIAETKPRSKVGEERQAIAKEAREEVKSKPAEEEVKPTEPEVKPKPAKKKAAKKKAVKPELEEGKVGKQFYPNDDDSNAPVSPVVINGKVRNLTWTLFGDLGKVWHEYKGTDYTPDPITGIGWGETADTRKALVKLLTEKKAEPKPKKAAAKPKEEKPVAETTEDAGVEKAMVRANEAADKAAAAKQIIEKGEWPSGRKLTDDELADLENQADPSDITSWMRETGDDADISPSRGRRKQRASDAEYLDAVERGDTAGAQRMVDQAARNAGYTSNTVYHGTTHKFSVFKLDRGNSENDFGVGHYFSTSKDDVATNYAGVGPDLTNRVETRVDVLEGEGSTRAAALKQAEKELVGGERRVIKAYVKTDNPAIFGKDDQGSEMRFEMASIYDEATVADKMPEIRKEIAAEEGVKLSDVDEVEVRQRAEDWADENGYFNEEPHPLQSAVERVSRRFDEVEESSSLNDIIFEEPTYAQVEDVLRKEVFPYAVEKEGDYRMSAGDAVKQVFQELGHDGIIDRRVSGKFKNMGLAEGDTHVIVFKANQIKSAEPITRDANGNVIPLSERFNPARDDISFSRGRTKRGRRVEGEGAPRRFPERAASRAKDLKAIRESRPDIASFEPQSVKARIDTMKTRSDENLMDSVNSLENLTVKSEKNFHVADAIELLQRARREGDEAKVTHVFEKLSKAGTTIGQLLNQFRLFKGTVAKDKVAMLNNFLIHKDKRLTDSQKEKFSKLVEEDDEAAAKYIEERDRAISEPSDENINKALNAEDAQEATYQSMQRYAQSMIPRESKAADALTVIQGNLLTGVSLGRNAWGNYIQIPVRAPTRAVAAGLDYLFSKVTKKKRTVTVAPIARPHMFLKNSWRAIKKAPREYYYGAPADNVTGEKIRGFQPIRSLAQAFTGDLPVDAATGKVRKRDRAKKVMEAVFGMAPEPMLRGLTLFDNIAKAGFRQARLVEEAKLRGAKKGTSEYAKIILGQDEESKKGARQEELEYTFQEDGIVSTAVLSVERYLNQVPHIGPSIKFGLRVATSPYVKTPVNLATQIVTYSFPSLALVEGFAHGIQGKRREATISAGKFFVANVFAGMAGWLIEDELITGGPDTSTKLNKMRTASGMGYFRFNWDGFKRKMNGGDGRYRAGDTTMRLDFLGIAGGAFAIHAEAHRLNKRERDYALKSGLTQKLYLDELTSVTSLGRFMMDQTMLRGMSEGLQALDTGNFTRWQASILNQITTIVPMWANSFTQNEARKWDYKPSLYDADPGISFANIVHYRRGEFDDLPVVRDIWGRKAKQTPEGQNPLVYAMLDIRKPTKVTDQARVRLFKLYEATGNSDVIPSWPKPTVTLANNEKLTLPADLYDTYVEQIQGAKLQAFTQVVSDPRWYKMNEETAVNVLKKRMTRFGTKAKNLWVAQNTRALNEQLRLLKEQQGR